MEQYLDDVLNVTYDYTYDSLGNQSEMNTYDSDGLLTNHETYQYDLKKNPYRQSTPPALQKLNGVGPNNMTSKTLFIQIMFYEYSYNASGYPTQLTYEDESGLGTIREKFYY